MKNAVYARSMQTAWPELGRSTNIHKTYRVGQQGWFFLLVLSVCGLSTSPWDAYIACQHSRTLSKHTYDLMRVSRDVLPQCTVLRLVKPETQRIDTNASYKSLSWLWTPLYVQESNLMPCLQQLKLNWNWVAQQDNDPKHSSKSTVSEKENNQCCNGPKCSPQPHGNAVAGP